MKQGNEPNALFGKSLLEIVRNAEEQGKTQKEVADFLNINYSTLRTRVAQAREEIDVEELHRQAYEDEPEAEVSREHENVNTFTATSRSPRITTLPELLEAAEANLDVWEVEHWVSNKWDGQLKGGAPIPLWQVKAWLVRKKPLEIEHTVQPVSLKLGKLSKVKKDYTGYRGLVIPDIQFGYRKQDNNELDPFHDRKALDIVLQVAQDYYFDSVIFLGDVVDLSEFSDHYVTEPWFYRTTQASLLETTWYLGQIRSANPEAEIEVLEGNHEHRFEKAMMNHLQSAYGLRPSSEVHLSPSYDLERLLDLETVGANWVGNYPDGRVWLNDRLHARHGDISRKQPGHTASAIIRESDCSVMFGHVHRIERVSRTIETRDGERTIFAASPGFLGRTDYQIPGHEKGYNWQQGLGIVHYDKDDSAIELLEIKDGKMRYGNKEYVARDIKEQLCEDTEWEF